MDPDDFVNDEEAAEIEAQKREMLRQMQDISDKIESAKKKLERLEDANNHLKIYYESRFRQIEYGGQYAGRWRRSESDFNSRLTGNVRRRADRIEDAVNHYVRGVLDPILEGVHREGLNIEILVLFCLRIVVLDSIPILEFERLLRVWPPQSMETEDARSARKDLEDRETRSKVSLFITLVFLVLFVMETEGYAGAYGRFMSQLESASQLEVEGGGNPAGKMPLISKFLTLLKEAQSEGGELMNLRRMTRNILECYSSMTFQGEVSDLMELLVERMQHLDIVLQDIPRWRDGDCIVSQLEWGDDMMTRCEETVKSVSEQMSLVYGPCFDEFHSVMATCTIAALATIAAVAT